MINGKVKKECLQYSHRFRDARRQLRGNTFSMLNYSIFVTAIILNSLLTTTIRVS